MFTGVEVAVSAVDHLHSVPDALCYEMGRETQLYQQAHVAVSQVVDAYTGYPGLFSAPLDISSEQAICEGEYPVVGVYTVYLAGVCQYLSYDGWRHNDTPDTVLCFWRAYGMHTLMERLGDADSIGGEIDVTQGEGHHLTKPHT